MADRFMPVTGGITYIEHGGADEEVKIRVKAIDNAESGLKGMGRVFYVSPNGNNENEGTSPDSPCRTVEAVRSLCYWLQSGDTVLFERGGIYRMTFDLDLISGVSYGAYGSGEKPVILGSYINYAKEEIWERVDGNIWAIPYFPHTDAGLMVFDGGSSSGIKCFSMEELTHNNYYFHDLDEHCLYMYSDKGNPALLYKEIEIGTMTRFFHLPFGTHDINIDNIDFKVSGLFAIRADGGCKNISITNCAFSWIGGSLFPNRSNRFGNAIEFSTSCENVLVENCHFYQLYDSGVSFQIGKGPFKNFTVRGNVFEYTGMAGFEWWGEHSVGGGEIPFDDTAIENILIENNIMHMNGYGWSGITRHPCHIRGTWAPRDYTNLKNFTVKNNIFDCSRGFIFACAWSGIPKEYITENNTYYQKASVKLNENDPGYPAFDMEYKHRTYAENQEELEAAVRAVEPHAKLVKWLD